MRLYSYWRSSASYRVRIALHYKELAFEYVPVNIIKDGGEQHRPEYAGKNPMSQVPTLEFEEGGVTRRIAQSLAIIEFLEQLHPARPLLPLDPYLRAKTRELAEIINAGIQPFQNTSTLKIIKDELGGDDLTFPRRFIEKGLHAFQAIVEETGGRFSVGDAPTMADACLLPQLIGARRYGVDLSKLARLVRVEEHCLALSAFESARPERQIDAPPA
jgi:maleylacetoacetate isomerase